MESTARLPQNIWIRRKRPWLAQLAWALLIILALRFIARDALRYFGMDAETFGRFWPHRVWLLGHISGGLLALGCGPFQFWSSLRRDWRRAHRLTGRLYLLGVLLAGSTALWLAFFIPESDGGWAAGVALSSLAIVWLCTAALALLTIRRRQFRGHTEWVIRSYVLTFAFVNLRLWLELPVISSAGTNTQRLIAVDWLAWALPLFITEVLLYRKRSQGFPLTKETR
jgi:hypothetical protein